MQRKTLWQLSAIAATAALLGVAQAQSDSTQAAAVESDVIVEKADPSERDVTQEGTQPITDAAADASTTTTETTTEPAQPAAATTTTTSTTTAPATNDQQVVVTTPPLPAEPQPITREGASAEAIQAQENGLLPHGEMSVPHEDKSWHWQNGMGL